MTRTTIAITWNAQTTTYQATVQYRGKTARFALPDAVNEWDARNQAEQIMRDYRRESVR
jgi:hypothetical protein